MGAYTLYIDIQTLGLKKKSKPKTNKEKMMCTLKNKAHPPIKKKNNAHPIMKTGQETIYYHLFMNQQNLNQIKL